MFHGESLLRRLELSRCFTGSLVLVGRIRLVLHGESRFAGRVVLPRSSLVSSTLRFFTASLFFAGRSRLGFSQRVSSLQV